MLTLTLALQSKWPLTPLTHAQSRALGQCRSSHTRLHPTVTEEAGKGVSSELPGYPEKNGPQSTVLTEVPHRPEARALSRATRLGVAWLGSESRRAPQPWAPLLWDRTPPSRPRPSL